MNFISRLFVLTLSFFLGLTIVSPVFGEEVISNWSSTSSIPNLLASHTSFVIKNKIYVLGGSAATGQSHSGVIFNIPSSNGTLGSWLSSTTFPIAPIYQATTVKENNVYVLGGLEENPGSAQGFVPKVFLNKALPDGALSSWEPLNPLPVPLGQGGTTIIGKWIYYLGGKNSNSVSDKVYYSFINDDGSIDDWSTSLVSLPHPMTGLGVVSYKNNIIVVGGVVGGVVTNKVYKAAVDPANGTISEWQELTNLPSVFNGTNQVIVVENKLITVGGGDSNGPTKKVLYTTINSDGTIQDWVESGNVLPQPVGGGAIGYVNGYLYSIGGYNNGYLNNVYYSKLNIDKILGVPLLKQTDPFWGDLVYDSANLWSPQDPSIARWGCALTSAAMTFNYHGIVTLPNDLPLTPKRLNEWLKSEVDGYVGSGLVNWLALSRLSKEAKPKNPDFLYDALEYSRTGFNSVTLKDDLKNNIPLILEVPGHFIVAQGSTNDTFYINDPYYSKTLLSDYGNTALSMGKFTPSNTDLSYVMLITDEGINLSAFQKFGPMSVPAGSGFLQQPLVKEEGAEKSGPPMYFHYIPKPTDGGDFLVNISSNTIKPYTLKAYFYDVEGRVRIETIKGIVGDNIPDSYTILFNKQNSQASKISKKYSFDSLIADLDRFYKNKLITNSKIYKALRLDVVEAKKFSVKQKKLSRTLLGAFIIVLDSSHKIFIKTDAYQVLRPQAVFLYNSLKP
ncbi:MAG: C39 family peptidase [Candidatus Levybacteria bacterium]|nr:C39 family peptidase [Candidatus Levybacteria bacterium]MBP9814743.1 C39 family peptidase [Candidatus Levybacteria bacterium]